MNDLYDEYYDDDDDAVTFIKFRPKPKREDKDSKHSKKNTIRDKRLEKAMEREEIAEKEIHGIF